MRQYENTETQVTVGKGYYKEAFAGFQRWKSGEALMSVCSHFYGPTHPLFLEKIYFKIPKIYPPLVLQHCHFVHKIYIYIYTYTHTHTHTQALASVVQLVGASSCNQKVAGSIPSQGTCLGCKFNPQSRYIWEATNRCFFFTSMFLSLFPFFSPFLPL